MLSVAGAVVAVLSLTAVSPRPARTAASHRSPAHTLRTATTPTSTSTVPRQSSKKPFAIGERTQLFQEPASADIATSTVADQPLRDLPTLILYPTAGTPGAPPMSDAAPDSAAGPFPLIVFSQGFDAPVSDYLGLLDSWVRAGYVVAAPTYPRTAPNSPQGLNEADIVNHPGDLQFVISSLVSATRQAGGPLTGLIDPQMIAIAGQSDGGDVTLAAAANPCCRIASVKAAVILSGAEYPAFNGTYYATGSVPLLVTQGDQDTVNAPGCSAALYDQAPAPKYYVDLLGAQHQPPYAQPGPARRYVAHAVVAFLDDYLKGDPAPLQAMLRRAGAPNVATLSTAVSLAGASTYCP